MVVYSNRFEKNEGMLFEENTLVEYVPLEKMYSSTPEYISLSGYMDVFSKSQR